MFNFSLITLLQTLPGIIIGLTVHEFSHAYVAYLCGDRTAKDMGRLSLNPLKHIDPLGFLFIVFAGFWWAKPVVFDKNRIKKSSDAIKIALAGPISNAFLAILLSWIFAFLLTHVSSASFDKYRFLIDMLSYGIFINWGLFVFNLLPIPPLDGSHVFLSQYMNHPNYENIYRYGTIALFIALLLESQFHLTILPIRPMVVFLSGLFLNWFGVG